MEVLGRSVTFACANCSSSLPVGFVCARGGGLWFTEVRVGSVGC